MRIVFENSECLCDRTRIEPLTIRGVAVIFATFHTSPVANGGYLLTVYELLGGTDFSAEVRERGLAKVPQALAWCVGSGRQSMKSVRE